MSKCLFADLLRSPCLSSSTKSFLKVGRHCRRDQPRLHCSRLRPASSLLPMTESARNVSEDLAELVEACPFPTIQCDTHGRFLLTNTAFSNLLEVLNIPHDQ